MGELQDVIGPLISTHPEAVYLFGLIKAIEDGSIDERVGVISALLRPPAAPTGNVGLFL